MFDYFRNSSSNAHQVGCEDSPTEVLYNICQSDDLDLHLKSQLCLKLDKCLTCSLIVIFRTILNKLGMAVGLCMVYMHMLISMTLTLMKDNSGLAE